MESRLFEIFYYIGLPLIISWAFMKFIGKSIAFIGVLGVLSGILAIIYGFIEYIIYSNLGVLKFGIISLVFGFLAYLFGGVLIISDPSKESDSVMDKFIEKLSKKMEDKSKHDES